MFRFYALTAAAAVLKYVEYIQCVVFARESLKIEYHSSENTMIIGKKTIASDFLNWASYFIYISFSVLIAHFTHIISHNKITSLLWITLEM